MADPKEWSDEKYQRFTDLFGKLKRNREQVPLEVLQTKYAAAYQKMTDEIEDLSDWFCRCYIESLAFTTNPKDTKGNEWLDKKIEAIQTEVAAPGNLVEQYKKALIEDLNIEKYYELVWRIFDRMDREAYDPYLQRYNVWTGPPENRWIYNGLLKAFWKKDESKEDGGYWIDSDGSFKGLGHPPRQIRGDG